jgi:hypothetical protein
MHMQQANSLEAVRPLLERMAESLRPVFRASVTPIAVIRGEQTYQWGTGTFFRVVDNSFLVTASHVWDEAARHGVDRELCAFDPGDQIEEGVSLRPVPLAGSLHRAKDPADVAVLELAPEVVGQLRGVRFLRLDQVALRPRPGCRCWVFGFPAETVQDVRASSLFRFNQFSLLAPQHDGDAALEGYNPAYHFLLDAARDDLWLPDGTASEMPHRLNGISGCSVWQPEWPPGNDPALFNPDRTRVVGVQTGYYRKQSLIKATGWGAVANVLYQRRPDLRGVIEMHLGPP